MFFDLLEAFAPHDHLNPLLSAVVVFGLVPGAMALTFRSLHRRVQTLARELARYDPLPAGRQLLEAHVVRDDDPTPAVVVQVDEEEVTRQGRSGSYKTWVEQRERVTARPFTVRQGHAEKTRVEPGEAPYVHREQMTEVPDALVTTPPRRTRTFHLMPGTQVVLYGRRAEGDTAASGGDNYREASRAIVLRPPEDGALEIHAASPAPALREELERSRFWRLLCPFALVLLEVIAFSNYLAQVTLGRAVDATVTETSSSTAHGWSGGRYGGHRTTYTVRSICAQPREAVAARRQTSVCSNASRDDVARFPEGAAVRVLLVEGWPDAEQLGEHGSVHELAALAALAAVFIFASNAPRGPVAPWREQRGGGPTRA